jgi:uncharacterized caspase-like protein
VLSAQSVKAVIETSIVAAPFADRLWNYFAGATMTIDIIQESVIID